MHDLVSSVANPEDLPLKQLTLVLPRPFLCCLASPVTPFLAKAVVGGLCAVVAAFAMIGWNAIITEVSRWVGGLSINVDTFLGKLFLSSTSLVDVWPISRRVKIRQRA